MPLEIDLGITGSKDGMTSAQKVSFRKIARRFYGQFHEGDCIGADVEAAKMIDEIGGYFIHIHPPTNPRYRANWIPKDSEHRLWEVKPYGDRDLDIVYESDAMVATPRTFSEIKRGSGTWLTIRLARAELRPLAIIWRDGTIQYERWPSMFPKVTL